MYPFTRQISLIRYLIVWRVNGPLVWLPACLAAEISQVLGTLIANRLPTPQAAPWRRAMALREGAGERPPPSEIRWPIEAVILVYPGKRTYGQGELIRWELKLLGESADHGLFLEVILPAMEEAATTTSRRWCRLNSLWGRFDLQALHVARGNRWEPFVQAGKLNLDHPVTPGQWADRPASQGADRLFERLIWLTPFDLSPPDGERARTPKPPTLREILEGLIRRMALFLPGKHHTADEVWANLSAEERSTLQAAVEDAGRIPVQQHRLGPTPKSWPGGWLGSERFPFIPPSLLPYLELASILHVGRQTHLGYGTFMLA